MKTSTKILGTFSRWCFTDAELSDLVLFTQCRASDEFLATSTDLDGAGVIIFRDGTVSNQYADGTAGVTEPDRVAASEDESPYDFHNNDIADNWRNVMVSPDGSPVLEGSGDRMQG